MGRDFHEHMDMFSRQNARDDLDAKFFAQLPYNRSYPLPQRAFQHLVAILRDPDDVIPVVKNRVTPACVAHRPDVWADSAYRSAEIEEKLADCGLKSRIHRSACRNRKLSEAQKAANTTRSKVRPVSSMYLVIKRTAWEPSSCAPSA